jgi:hypothetical protein
MLTFRSISPQVLLNRRLVDRSSIDILPDRSAPRYLFSLATTRKSPFRGLQNSRRPFLLFTRTP